MNDDQLTDLLVQALEHARGGIQIYRKALECVLNEQLDEEWTKYLSETERHEAILLEIFSVFGLDPEMQLPSREVIAHNGRSLVEAMVMAQEARDEAAAEIVAAECVVLAETKDHMSWELLGLAAKKLTGDAGEKLRAACEEVEGQEDEHLYHTKGWCRELHMVEGERAA